MKLCDPAGDPESKEAEYHTVSDVYDILWYPECFIESSEFLRQRYRIAGSKSNAEGKQEEENKNKKIPRARCGI